MKKQVSLFLALILLCSMVMPSFAAETADQRLAAVTAQVKETLQLETDRYSSFHGDLDDNPLAPVWYLEWSDDEGASMSIEATEAGKIIGYRVYENSTAYQPAGQFSPVFPKGDYDTAKKAAQDFLSAVLDRNETAKFAENTTSLRLGAESFQFRGEILVNGLSAGLSFSVSVRCTDNEIIRFYRDDFAGQVMGGIPSPAPVVTEASAASLLRGTLSLRLEYVLPEGEGKQAVLRWLPDWGDDYYVDAATGDLVNLTEIYKQVEAGGKGTVGGSNGAASDSAAEGAPAAGLSPAEQEGIAKLEGVLSREELDAEMRRISALGLGKYTLAAASYSVARETEEGETPLVTAVLRYGRQLDGYSWRRTVSVDARTGELLSVYSSGRLPDEKALSVDADQARAKAEAFLTELNQTQFSKTGLYDSSEAAGAWSFEHRFTYAQKENGYFFAGNYFDIGIDASDGSVSEYSKSFDDEIAFDSAEGICSSDQAIDAWLDTYDTSLQYVLVPSAVDFSRSEYAPLKNWGFSYLYKLVLGYQLARDRNPLGIDAKTAKPVYRSEAPAVNGLAYSDISGHWAEKQIRKLAEFNIGYSGESFQPNKSLTQADLIALLLSAEGYLYRPDEDGSLDRLYDLAYSYGILRREERKEDALLTRADAIKLILDASGYGAIAQLQGIFRTDFSDEKDIPAGCLGYAALAQGLGIASGAPGAKLLPNRTASRAEAAVMLFNLMDR